MGIPARCARRSGRKIALPLAVLAVAVALGAADRSAAVVFTQETTSWQPDGTPLPVTRIDPAARDDLRPHDYDLGAGRSLRIATNLAPARGAEIDSVAAVVRRCYAYLARSTGREVSGGVLLYLLEFPTRPLSYRFTAEVDAGTWRQVRVALLSAGQPLLGPGAASHVTEFIYDTLPHELAHGLLSDVPTVAHDRDGGPSRGTRWFIEGVCEVLAKGFAGREAPAACAGELRGRRLAFNGRARRLEPLVWDWGTGMALDWPDECGLYGLSLLLVSAWTEQVDLAELLARLSARGGGADGAELERVLAATTGLGRGQLLARACALGGSAEPGSRVSLLQ